MMVQLSIYNVQIERESEREMPMTQGDGPTDTNLNWWAGRILLDMGS